MAIGRLGTDKELRPDLAIGFPLGEQAQNGQLPHRKQLMHRRSLSGDWARSRDALRGHQRIDHEHVQRDHRSGAMVGPKVARSKRCDEPLLE